MNPQDPNQTSDESQDNNLGQPANDPFTPTPTFGEPDATNQSPDSESLQAIEALESEDSAVAAAEVPSVAPEPITSVPVDSEPAVAGASDAQAYANNPAASPVEPPVVTPVEASAAGLAAAAGAQAGSSFGAQQAPTSNPSTQLGAPKKKSKLILIVAIVLVGLAAGVAAFFYWQSTQTTSTPTDSTVQTGGDLPGGGNGEVQVNE